MIEITTDYLVDYMPYTTSIYAKSLFITATHEETRPHHSLPFDKGGNSGKRIIIHHVQRFPQIAAGCLQALPLYLHGSLLF